MFLNFGGTQGKNGRQSLLRLSFSFPVPKLQMLQDRLGPLIEGVATYCPERVELYNFRHCQCLVPDLVWVGLTAATIEVIAHAKLDLITVNRLSEPKVVNT